LIAASPVVLSAFLLLFAAVEQLPGALFRPPPSPSAFGRPDSKSHPPLLLERLYHRRRCTAKNDGSHVVGRGRPERWIACAVVGRSAWP